MQKMKRLYILIFSILLLSCENETIVRDADYPAQSVYLPAAIKDKRFVINDITRKKGEQPIKGYLYRYIVDGASNKFIVPLYVYRAGIDNKGSFNVGVSIVNDTLSILNKDKAPEERLIALPKDKYSIANSVHVPDGQESSRFTLAVDLDFLMKNYPDKLFAAVVKISCADRKVSPGLGTVIVVIDTKIMKPTADFSFSSDGKKISFYNKSLMANKYVWNFGDGYYSDAASPIHTYEASGTYTVTLTAVGISGNKGCSVLSKEITVY